MVEADTSELGVGPVLSQRSHKDNKFHPCFSHRLSPAKRNYDIGDRELLVVKLALEEWRHWLERTASPFLVWTDHKNLVYLRSAKRLNIHQARWSLFFAGFNFTLSYHPGSKNLKPDALSQLHTPRTNADQDNPASSLSCGGHTPKYWNASEVGAWSGTRFEQSSPWTSRCLLDLKCWNRDIAL